MNKKREDPSVFYTFIKFKLESDQIGNESETRLITYGFHEIEIIQCQREQPGPV